MASSSASSVHALSSNASIARRLPALGAIALGLVLIYGVGFAQPSMLHNAAHDGRHAFSFPCH
jgi:cobalt transporter subunit CbtB